MRANRPLNFLGLIVLLAVTGFVVLAGCGPGCNAPSKTTYSCQPAEVTAGSSGCVGGPQLSSDGGRTDSDKLFSVGCVAELPYCAGAYPTDVASCTCEAGGQWICPV